MRKFKPFVQNLHEILVKFGGKAYPKFGQFVIIAGGGGSGKGFVRNKLLGIEGLVFDVDALKKLILRSHQIKQKVKEDFGYDLDKFDMNNPDDVSNLHSIVGDILSLDKRKNTSASAAILASAPDRKPNIIFDVTLSGLQKFNNLTKMGRDLGYLKENVHLVWVVNDIEIAKKQNLNRNRTVPVEILVNTHRGVSETMHDILTMGETLETYMDGDITIVFNKAGVDSSILKSENGGLVIDKQNYVTIKKSGQPIMSLDDVAIEIKQKIADYVPHGVSWI